MPLTLHFWRPKVFQKLTKISVFIASILNNTHFPAILMRWLWTFIFNVRLRIVGLEVSNVTRQWVIKGFSYLFFSHIFDHRPSHPEVLESNGQLTIFVFIWPWWPFQHTTRAEVRAKCQQHLKCTWGLRQRWFYISMANVALMLECPKLPVVLLVFLPRVLSPVIKIKWCAEIA